MKRFAYPITFVIMHIALFLITLATAHFIDVFGAATCDMMPKTVDDTVEVELSNDCFAERMKLGAIIFAISYASTIIFAITAFIKKRKGLYAYLFSGMIVAALMGWYMAVYQLPIVW
jgi:hypothetical protein